MESLLNQPLFQVQGRQSQLTLAREQLLVQARALLARAESPEINATDSALAQRQEIALAVDVLLPGILVSATGAVQRRNAIGVGTDL